MSASYTRTDRVLSVRERENLKRDIAERERAIQGHLVVPHVNGAGQEGMSSRRQGRWEGFLSNNEDKGALRSQMNHMKRILTKGSPRDLSRKEKRELEKQVQEDREYFKKNMVSKKVYEQPSVFHEGDSRRSNPNFLKAQKAVFEKEVSNREFNLRANRYKNNMRELDPDSPDSANIERFRPKK